MQDWLIPLMAFVAVVALGGAGLIALAKRRQPILDRLRQITRPPSVRPDVSHIKSWLDMIEALGERISSSTLSGKLAAQLNQAGLLRQHTIFDYEFQPGSDQLNPLSRRNLELMAIALREHPRNLCVQRCDAPRGLYLARLRAVREALGRVGVDTRRITLNGEAPGGDGLPSEQVYKAYTRDPDKTSGNSGSYVPVVPINTNDGK